jgi:hypothetical protein
MTQYCAVKKGKAFEGTKEEVVAQICKFYFDNDNALCVKFDGYPSERLHGYSKAYSSKESYNDAVQFLFLRASQYGFKVYSDDWRGF